MVKDNNWIRFSQYPSCMPKLYRVVTIRFWSLRNEIGCSGGMIFDVDTVVERKCRRVLCSDGWKWQIANLSKIKEYDYAVVADQFILDEIGGDDSDVIYI